MKSMKIILLSLGLTAMLCSAEQSKAQFMPVVYDNIYGKENRYAVATADFLNGDIVTASETGNRIVLTWLDRNGETRFSKRFNADELSAVSSIVVLDENNVLVLGRGKSGDRDRNRANGRAMLVGADGKIGLVSRMGIEETVVTNARRLANGNFIIAGTHGTKGFISKIDAKGREIFSYTASTGESCDWFDTQGGKSEYTNAAFSGNTGSSVARLDANGKPYFVTTFPDPTFRVGKMISTADGDIYLAGQGQQTGGAVIKLRPEGDIVFCKQLVPAGSATKLDQLVVCPSGEVVAGGNDAKNAYYAMFRPDGTELASNVDNGMVTAIANNSASGDCLISLYAPATGKGKVVKISKQGRRLYEKYTAACYTSLRINDGGDLLMAAPETGRLTMLSNLGELLFDRFVIENTPTNFVSVSLPSNGEAVFFGADNRIAKLAHGVYVSDIQVNKPINGYTTAVFTVTLSGYAFSHSGAPLPVTVNYKTTPLTAMEGRNFDPVSGVISFIPSTDGSERYLNKYIVEVPVTANDFLEGERTFALELSNAGSSYLIRSAAQATIVDQPAVVKMISTAAGVENQKDITYTLGLFKTNGTSLTNTTGSDIVIDGVYGNGTADRYDFDMGIQPRLVIASNQHSGRFDAKTLEDTRYESIKTVVVNFNRVSAMSDSEISFGSNMLTCTGELYDQPALVAIESLGDHTQFNNGMSGLFKISLLRARDGVLQTNNSGSDIVLTTKFNDNGTAKPGVNFVLTNAHDLRIWGDDRSSAVNLNGMVLYSEEKGVKTAGVSLTNVKAGDNAAKIGISSEKKSAQFNISTR